MSNVDLFNLRQSFDRENFMLSFNGPFSQSLIEELGIALKSYLEAESTSASSTMDVFSVYIEMTQNIRNYTAVKKYSEADASGIVVIGRRDDGHYFVSAGNVVEESDGQKLVERVRALAGLDKAALKAAYKEQLRRPREDGAGTGGGLGFIDMARKAIEPMVCDLRQTDHGRCFFSLHVML